MNTISTRARHVLIRAAYHNDTADLTADEQAWAQTVTPEQALVTLRYAAKLQGRSIHYLLMAAKGGGLITRHELFAWMSLADDHICVCRDCGRRMGVS